MNLEMLRNRKHFGTGQLPAHLNLQAEFVHDGRETFVLVHSGTTLGPELHDLA